MTKEEVIELAEQVGMFHDGDWWFSNYDEYQDVNIDDLVLLVNLALRKERVKADSLAAKQ
jgi:hypothetical protein